MFSTCCPPVVPLLSHILVMSSAVLFLITPPPVMPCFPPIIALFLEENMDNVLPLFFPSSSRFLTDISCSPQNPHTVMLCSPPILALFSLCNPSSPPDIPYSPALLYHVRPPVLALFSTCSHVLLPVLTFVDPPCFIVTLHVLLTSRVLPSPCCAIFSPFSPPILALFSICSRQVLHYSRFVISHCFILFSPLFLLRFSLFSHCHPTVWTEEILRWCTVKQTLPPPPCSRYVLIIFSHCYPMFSPWFDNITPFPTLLFSYMTTSLTNLNGSYLPKSRLA